MILCFYFFFFSKIIPSFFTIKEGVFLPLRLSCKERLFSKTYPSFLTLKEGSTFLTKPLFPQGREDVTALRCSEPLRYKVGGASKPSPCFAGWDRLNCSSLQYRSALVVARMRNIVYSTFDRITSGEVPIRVIAEIL